MRKNGASCILKLYRVFFSRYSSAASVSVLL
jgi:hypothetical protein